MGIIGLYGVIAYAISQHTREIGIRMALGAQRATLTRMYVREGLILTVIGVIGGVAVAFAIELSTRLQAAVGGAFLARLGGDEFVVIATDGEQPAAAEAMADRLLAAVNEAIAHQRLFGAASA